ncbi:MAG: hypothetical protein HC765_04615 [Brachymonas sp.]|nr:hypothetical protein [Brachymonas sp.]
MIFKQKRLLAGVLSALSAMTFIASSAFAQAHSAADIKKDIERHKAMAAAHTSAAQCLESGKKYDACMDELQKSCKGLGIGKHCGMRHVH